MTPRSATALLALAGLAAATDAQTTTGIISLSVNATVVSPGETYTYSVVVDDNGVGDGSGVFAFNISAFFAPDVVYEFVSPPTPNPAIFGFDGGLTAGAAYGLGGSTDILGPTYDAPLNGLAVFTFQAIVHGVIAGPGDEPGDVGWAQLFTAQGLGPNPALLTVEEGGLILAPIEYDEIVFGSLGFTTVILPPAPSSLAPIGLVALLATRRRR